MLPSSRIPLDLTVDATAANGRPRRKHSTAVQPSYVQLVLTLCIFTAAPALAFCPSKCTCDDDSYLRVQCPQTGLEVVPIQLNPEVKIIDLALNQITNVDFTLSFYNQLQMLNLTRNRVDHLNENHFLQQRELLVLDLSHNRVDKLQRNAFAGLVSLKRLLLNDNRLQTVHHNAFAGMHSLDELQLANNKLSRFGEHTFKPLSGLRFLNLANNEIMEVPANENFQHLQRLVLLNLRENLIKEVANNSLAGLGDLVALQMRDNVIDTVDVDAFNGVGALKWLDLGDNNLTVLPTNSLAKLGNLTNLSLSGNRFTYLAPVSFLNLFNLRELHLDRLEYLAKIDARAFADNAFLVRMSLSNNPNLTDLPPRLFHGLSNLVDISMHSNGFHTLDAAQVPIDQLGRLQLAHNPFVCNCSLLWLWRLVKDTPSNSNSNKLIDISNSQVANTEDLLWTNPQYWADNALSGAVIPMPTMASTASTGGNRSSSSRSGVVGLLQDRDDIACDAAVNGKRGVVRRKLSTLTETDIECPAQTITIICAIVTILVVLGTGVSVLGYLHCIRRRKRILEERKNVNERIVPQHIDKMELERYLAGQTSTNNINIGPHHHGQHHLHRHHNHQAMMGTGTAAIPHHHTMLYQQQHHPQQLQQSNQNQYYPAGIGTALTTSTTTASTVGATPAGSEENTVSNSSSIKVHHPPFMQQPTTVPFLGAATNSVASHSNTVPHHPHHTISSAHHYGPPPVSSGTAHKKYNYLLPEKHQSHSHNGHPSEFRTLCLGGGGGGSGNSSSRNFSFKNQHENLINDSDTDHYEQFEYLDCRPSRLWLQPPANSADAVAILDAGEARTHPVVYV